MNYYVLLGVSPAADVETIRSAFRALVRRYHPDMGEGASAQKFREIVAAYETLADPVRRRRYDASLERARPVVSRRAEPMWRAPVPEPLIPARPTMHRRRPVRVVAATPAPDPFEEFFRMWDEAFRYGF